MRREGENISARTRNGSFDRCRLRKLWVEGSLAHMKKILLGCASLIIGWNCATGANAAPQTSTLPTGEKPVGQLAYCGTTAYDTGKSGCCGTQLYDIKTQYCVPLETGTCTIPQETLSLKSPLPSECAAFAEVLPLPQRGTFLAGSGTCSTPGADCQVGVFGQEMAPDVRALCYVGERAKPVSGKCWVPAVMPLKAPGSSGGKPKQTLR